jgi:anti-anti-sigma factor
LVDKLIRGGYTRRPGAVEIQIIKKDNAMVVSVTGRMDATTTPEYEQKLNQLIESGQKSFVIDFIDLEYISSAGLRGILVTVKAIKAAGGKIAFANIRNTVKDVFDISGFGTIFQINDSVESALTQIG